MEATYAERAADDLLAVLDLAAPIYDQLNDEPADGSPAAAERIAGETWRHESWNNPAVGGQVDAVFQAGVADDHVRALASLLRQRDALFAVHSVARAGLETAATAYWLLGGDVEARVGRWCGSRVATWRLLVGALRKALPAADSFDARPEIEAQLAGAEERIERFRVAAHATGVAAVSPPRAEQRVQDLFGHGMARATYATLSGVAHGEPWALAQLLDRVDPGADEPTVLVAPALGDVRAGLLATSALVAHHRVLTRAVALWGVVVPLAWLQRTGRAIEDASRVVS